LSTPQDIKQLQRFLGMVNFYRRFLPKCAQILKPLTDLLKGGAKMLEWTVSAQNVFQNFFEQNASKLYGLSYSDVYDLNDTPLPGDQISENTGLQLSMLQIFRLRSACMVAKTKYKKKRKKIKNR
jgi:hypothetical protein